MDNLTYTSLADQVARQTPELAGHDADIAARQPTVDTLTAAVTTAQGSVDTLNAQRTTAEAAGDAATVATIDAALVPAQAALTTAQQALAGPAGELAEIKARAADISAAIAHCQSEMTASGLVLTTAGMDAQRLTEVKALMTDRIKAKRDAVRFDGGVLLGGHWFLSTQQATLEYTTLIAIAGSLGLPDTYVMRQAWRTMAAGVTVDMTPGLAKQILQTGLGAVSAIDNTSEAHIAAMTVAADPAAYDFSAGWPAVFPG